MKEKEDEFLLDLHQLSQEAIFNLMNFESTIDKIRTYVSEVSALKTLHHILPDEC